MKLYPSKHVIANVDSVDIREEVVIGYLNSDYIEEEVIIDIKSEYSNDFKKEMLPYETFINEKGFPNITIYDKDNNPLSKEKQNDLFSRMDSNYVYTPDSSITYEPYTFKYKVLAKKNIEYTSIRKFNIKIGCDNLSLANTLINFFANKYDDNRYPNNICFNNGDLKATSLITGDLREKSALIIESENGYEYLNGNIINIDELIEHQVVPIIFCDTIDNQPINNEAVEYLFEFKDQSITNIKNFSTRKYFKIPKESTDAKYTTPFYNTNNDFSPIIVKEIINKGYVIYINREILNNINTQYNFMYEMIIWSYLNGYVSTPIITEWICDKMPNFIVSNNKLVQKDKFTSHMELHKLVSLYENDVSPIEVIIQPPEGETYPIVYYTGMSSNYLIFKKISSTNYADPIQKENQISIYTSRKNIMYFDNFNYFITEDIKNKIKYTIDNNTIHITVNPFKNTLLDTYNFYIPINLSHKIEDIEKQSIFVCWSMETKTIFLNKAEENTSNIKTLAEIIIIREKKISKLYDMRGRGGGLPKGYTNYNCFDIANTLGTPYRTGGAMVCKIKLPLKYKDNLNEIYHKIYNSLNKDKLADDHIILNIEFE